MTGFHLRSSLHSFCFQTSIVIAETTVAAGGDHRCQRDLLNDMPEMTTTAFHGFSYSSPFCFLLSFFTSILWSEICTMKCYLEIFRNEIGGVVYENATQIENRS